MRLSICMMVVLVGGCAQSRESLVGVRADGLLVVCTPHGEGAYACDPQQDGDDASEDPTDGDGAAGEGEGGTIAVDPGAQDGCSEWLDGGPAIVLWPPNHHMHTITLEDCAAVRSECDAATSAAAAGGTIVSISSDEPLDVGAGGDGHTEAGDMQIVDARTVALRAERQGGADGRVYRIELVGPDGARDVCEVHVPHDRGPYGGAVAGPVAVSVRR